jgi:ribosome-binding protein aMBF1 (putative translation factor)
MNCFLCNDDITERPSVRVSFDGSIADVCDSCIEKADMDEPLDVALDMAMNREGDPAFNGAFNAW